ncbi:MULTISPECIES: cytochrome f [Prochlorococcus]|uniref:Cytochrome f n=1 Tax=Prochlorococcus marinus (strain SARG / CCMP1375 / SS120) TaxID=167539 RepID=CYF_PROMA|nr:MULTISPECIES: apocytochrome f [Prochlorococcus]Q7VDC1.1 RecName: Full=Cytochrome f; Flags: Precursor [Prochlorococcus marinus subsp. marinus str. CCMP1375]AAP99505.1 Apocytochrome F [Prochlorococcus marinus subsp. marinus str. CCMP1375]KGG11223.1 Cytochrome b6-f complex subunit [Prochlorococcus marinus str. LG]KGG21561.1 Cytochrome b6-f complex subunit [Prochlorococcus marinus str. SS2]KGG23096.1 Cytochrome b6-f complex subunit [Prochlorococcus marinus str. SS35]KGG33805.1 Cytochrome b6-f 
MRRILTFFLGSIIIGLSIIISPSSSFAYPFWAQQNYENPREATGKLVCANCHLAKMTTQVEVPQSVGADSVFKAAVKIPYKPGTEEIGADGSKVPLQVGAVVMLPDGFKLAPQDRWTEDIKEETKGVYFTQYSEEKDNIILVGPLPGDQNKEIVFPILSPDPAKDKNIHFGKYSINVGGNRGRGQVYPTGEKSNNSIFTSTAAGLISTIEPNKDGGTNITIQTESGEAIIEEIPVGPSLVVKEGQTIDIGIPLTSDPNVGGFGQLDTEIVLQSPARVIGLIAFFAGVALTQILLVLKKKQVEKVQAAEGI